MEFTRLEDGVAAAEGGRPQSQSHQWPFPRTLSVSVQFSRSVLSDPLQPHGLQHARPPCPSPTPGVYSNPRPSSCWCHPAISSSVVPFSSRLQSFPASGSFLSVCASVNSNLLLLPYHWALLFPACQFSRSIYFVFTVWKLAHPALYSRLLCDLCFSVNYRADISVSGNMTQSGGPFTHTWPASHQCSQIPVRFFLSMWLYRRRKWQSILVFLVNPVDRGVWWATVHGVAKSQTQLSD